MDASAIGDIYARCALVGGAVAPSSMAESGDLRLSLVYVEGVWPLSVAEIGIVADVGALEVGYDFVGDIRPKVSDC